ncbi:MAG: prepilin peptidase [Pseudomonadota bacterium]
MIALLTLAAFPAALIIAAAHDLYEFKIPNWISILLATSYFAAGLATGTSLSVIFEGAMLGAGALVIGFILFARNVIGGGDAKLLAGSVMWVGYTGLGLFLVNTALAGAMLAALLMLFRKAPAFPMYAQAPWLLRLHQRTQDVPYAVAICAGGLLTFQDTLFVQRLFGA